MIDNTCWTITDWPALYSTASSEATLSFKPKSNTCPLYSTHKPTHTFHRPLNWKDSCCYKFSKVGASCQSSPGQIWCSKQTFTSLNMISVVEQRIPRRAQGLSLYQPNYSNLIYERKSGNVLLPGRTFVYQSRVTLSHCLTEVCSHPFLDFRKKTRASGGKREKEGDVSGNWEWAGLKLTLLTSSGPKAKHTASKTGFILHNHDPVPLGRGDHFHFDPLLNSGSWFFDFRLGDSCGSQ